MDIEIIAVGGYDEVGRNMTAVRCGKEIVIFDMGLRLDQVMIHEDAEIENMHSLDLIKIKAIVWCAGQGDNKVQRMARGYLFNACGTNPRLLLKLNFWKQSVRLLVGKLAIWLNVKWHQQLSKY